MNYIVYKTTNLINGKIYVGVHRTNPDIFDGYIGCGVTYKDKKKNTKGFPKAVLKYGYNNFKRETLFIYPDTPQGKIDAYNKESEIVNLDFIKRNDTYNLVKGGIISMSENNKIKIAQYTINGEFIRIWDSIKEAEEKIGKGIYNAVAEKTKYSNGFQWKYYYGNTDNIDSVEIKEKSVYQFDLQGNLLKCWKSITEASKLFANPISAKIAISNCCNKRTHQSFGFYWSFKSKFEYVHVGVGVAKYNDDGIFLESYTSLTDAAKLNNIKQKGNIIAAIKGTLKRCGGFRWRYFCGDTSNIKPLR